MLADQTLRNERAKDKEVADKMIKLTYANLFTGFLFLFLLFSSSNGENDQNALPKEAQLVQNYILNTEYLELFDTTHYRIKCENMLADDIDCDGTTEVILHLFPHYRQSPTIVIYRVFKNDSISRVTEGFAPGNPLPATDKYLDSHTLGMAMDMVADNMKQKPVEPEKLLAAARNSSGGCIVLYQTFIHMDMRIGNPSYVDMRHIKKLPGKPQTCEGFEFPDVSQILIGNYNDKGKCLFCLTNKELDILKIKSFLASGLIDKER
jgi:hypothetical protein